MKSNIKCFIFICIAIIGILILLCVLNEYKKKTNDITYKSVTGQLENGKQYQYYGIDNNKFDLEKFIKENRLRLLKEEDGDGTIYTFESIVQRFETIAASYEEGRSIEDELITIYFDKRTDSWVVMVENALDKKSEWVFRGGTIFLVIQRLNGAIKYYTDNLGRITLEDGSIAYVLPNGRLYPTYPNETIREEFDWESFQQTYQLNYYKEYKEEACMTGFQAAMVVDSYIEEHNTDNKISQENVFIKVYSDDHTKNFVVMETFAPDYDFESSSNRYVWMIPWNLDDWFDSEGRRKSVVARIYSDKPFD